MQALFTLLVTVLISVSLVGAALAVVYAVARLSVILRPQTNDPDFGLIRYAGGSWEGVFRRGIVLRIAGKKAGLSDPARKLGQLAASNWALVREQCMIELADALANEIDAEIPERVLKIARSGKTAGLGKHLRADEVAIRSSGASGAVTAEMVFTPSWDEEHTLSVVLDDTLQIVRSGLTVAMQER